MANITVTNPMNIEAELKNLSLYKYHPNGILNVSLNRLQDMLDGKVEISDPSNPFTYLLETSCLNTAFAIQEYTLLTRKTYPRLANTEEDLYLHMSDVDYLDRFSSPATANVKFNLLLSDFKAKAHYDQITGERILKIPRHFKLSVGKYIFTLQSAVLIRLTDGGVMDVKYENQTFNSIFQVGTNYVNFDLYTANQTESYITFTLRMPEVDIETVEIPTEKSKLFKNTLSFNPTRKFYYMRAFYMKDGVWNEMLTTHTEQVYDIDTPTCIVKVLQDKNEVEYNIPPVYVNTGRIGTKVKFLVYTTTGAMVAKFSDYKISDFVTEYNPVFPQTELDPTTESLHLITKVIYIDEDITDGSDAIDFQTLKQTVIDNNVGDRKLPITNKQIETYVNTGGFKLIKDVDIVTNRIFLLECPVPVPVTRYPVSKSNMDMIEYKTSIADLLSGKNSVHSPASSANEVVILPEGTVFELRDNELYLLDALEKQTLDSLSGLSLVSEVNAKNYLHLYYHYVLDTVNNRTALRAYDLNSNEIKDINFKEFNPTCRVGINTTTTNMVKTSQGYTIYIASNFKRYDDAIEAEHNLTPYLVHKDEGGGYFFIKGTLFSNIDSSPIYMFKLNTVFNINSKNQMEIFNFLDSNGNTVSNHIELSTRLSLIYLSDIVPPGFEPSTPDTLLYGTYLEASNCVVTLEEITLVLGVSLDRLYSRVRSSVEIGAPEVYTTDVVLKHTKTVYAADNTILHNIGDIVTDENNEPVIKHHAGDVKTLSESNDGLLRYLNLLLMDYKSHRANSELELKYKDYLRKNLTSKISQDAVDVQDILLENTEGFVVVPKVIDRIRVKVKNSEKIIDGSQSFSVNLYVNRNVFEDSSVRDSLEFTVTKTIDDYLYENTKLNRTELLSTLFSKLKEFVITVQFDGFTEIDEEYIEMVHDNTRVSLSKTLVISGSGYEARENVNVNFNLIE